MRINTSFDRANIIILWLFSNLGHCILSFENSTLGNIDSALSSSIYLIPLRNSSYRINGTLMHCLPCQLSPCNWIRFLTQGKAHDILKILFIEHMRNFLFFWNVTLINLRWILSMLYNWRWVLLSKRLSCFISLFLLLMILQLLLLFLFILLWWHNLIFSIRSINLEFIYFLSLWVIPFWGGFGVLGFIIMIKTVVRWQWKWRTVWQSELSF